MLRVISGLYSGRKLKKPDLQITRPTTNRVKKAIFSIIQFKIKNSIFLDLFSGSGAISIEAISCGAMKAFAIEKNKKAFKIINENIENLKINNIVSINSDALTFLEKSKGKVFDFIYLDPPHNLNLFKEIFHLIDKNKILSNKGYIIVETNKFSKIDIPNNFLVIKNKKYGKTLVLLISKNV
jgi:16S rRNA (guanine966-N2)-methyltransferase